MFCCLKIESDCQRHNCHDGIGAESETSVGFYAATFGHAHHIVEYFGLNIGRCVLCAVYSSRVHSTVRYYYSTWLDLRVRVRVAYLIVSGTCYYFASFLFLKTFLFKFSFWKYILLWFWKKFLLPPLHIAKLTKANQMISTRLSF